MPKTLATKPTARRDAQPRPALTLRAARDAAKPANRLMKGPALRHEARHQRTLRDFRSVGNAAAHLQSLPDPGCSLHGVTTGNYSYCDLVPAVLRLIAPETIAYLAVTTLGFSARAMNQIVDLIDSEQIARVDFVCADFFEKADAEICKVMRAALTSRASRFASARCHAKILLLQTTDGRHLTSESSANIRACRSIEQFCLTNDRDLFDFHRRWISELVEAYVRKENA